MAKSSNYQTSRRGALAAIGAAAASFLTPARYAKSGSTASLEIAGGVVYEDSTGLGHRSGGDRGIAGVMVSNGRDVAITDREGRWSLPLAIGEHVFVIKPPNWAIAKRACAASFSYLHQPAGTPGYVSLAGPHVDPTGTLPPSIDFGLTQQPEADSFDVLLFADTQAADAQELDFVRRELLAATRGSTAAFAINHGDVMGDDLSLLQPYRRILDETGLVWHHCPGNHDMNLDSADPAYAFESWKRVIGPPHYAFQYSGATFILLNNVAGLDSHETDSGGRHYRGYIGAQQLDFVDNVLRHVPQQSLVVVSMHIPLMNYEAPNSASDTTSDRRRLLEILSQRPNTVSFSGHSHTTEHHYFGRDQGFDRDQPHHHHILTAACGSWWSGPADERGIPVSDSRDGSPKGFHRLTVDGNRYTTCLVPFRNSGNGQMRIVLQNAERPDRIVDQPIACAALPALRLLVNAFDGGPHTKVDIEIAGRLLNGVERTVPAITDPFIVESFDRHRALCKPWVAAAPSAHIWTAPLPTDLAAGSHDVVVRITGEYGQNYTATDVLTVV